MLVFLFSHFTHWIQKLCDFIRIATIVSRIWEEWLLYTPIFILMKKQEKNI